MRGLKRRIEQLEYATGAGSEEGIQIFLMHAAEEFALDLDRCADILLEAGFLQRCQERTENFPPGRSIRRPLRGARSATTGGGR